MGGDGETPSPSASRSPEASLAVTEAPQSSVPPSATPSTLAAPHLASPAISKVPRSSALSLAREDAGERMSHSHPSVGSAG